MEYHVGGCSSLSTSVFDVSEMDYVYVLDT